MKVRMNAEQLEQFIADIRASGYELTLTGVPSLIESDGVTVIGNFSFVVGSNEDGAN